MKTLFASLAVLGAALSLSAQSLIPQPKTITVNSGSFNVAPAQSTPPVHQTASVVIYTDSASTVTGQYLAAQLLKSTDDSFNTTTTSGSGAISGAILITTVGATTGLGAEGYTLSVTPTSVVIKATNQAGLFYGVQTLLQLMPPAALSQTPVSGVTFNAQCVTITDQPRFPWRGFMLDCARHFFTVSEVERMLDAMALHKLNTFHWHLVDDEGWRLSTPQYPLLTSVGAWRSGIDHGLNARASSAFNSSGQYGGYYTTTDIANIVSYATTLHITIVPEIEMPGHSTAGLASYPQYGCVHTGFDMDNPNYNNNIYSPGTTGTMTFLDNVLTNVIARFPGKYIHCGGDEVTSTLWKSTTADINKMNSLGINPNSSTAVSQYQHWFSGQISSFLQSKGKTMVGWSEIENNGTLTGAVCMDWQTGSSSKAVATAQASQYVVMTPTTHTYINFPQNVGLNTTNAYEPPAQPNGYLPLTDCYNWDPIPSGLASQYQKFILGTEGNLWAEYVPSSMNVQFKAFPRLCALAEVGWTPAASKSYTGFLSRLTTHEDRLSSMGLNYDQSAPNQVGGWNPSTITTTGTWGSVPPNTTKITIDITSRIIKAGEVDVSFNYTNGASALLTFSVALLKNGTQVDIDTHNGFTGAGFSDPTYITHLSSYSPSDTYQIKCSVAGWGGTSSYGGIYLPNWN